MAQRAAQLWPKGRLVLDQNRTQLWPKGRLVLDQNRTQLWPKGRLVLDQNRTQLWPKGCLVLDYVSGTDPNQSQLTPRMDADKEFHKLRHSSVD